MALHPDDEANGWTGADELTPCRQCGSYSGGARHAICPACLNDTRPDHYDDRDQT